MRKLVQRGFHVPVTTFEEFQSALDEHRLWVKENWKGGPRWYLVRRNGATKRWLKKSNAGRWEIPIKWKLDVTMRIGDYNFDVMKERFRAGVGPEDRCECGDRIGHIESCEHRKEGTKAHFERYVAGDR